MTSTQYGNWAVECYDCHTPHRTRNIFLVREALPTPNSGTATVVFQQDADVNMGYLGDRSGAANTPYDDGVCEACHTKTDHHRNDTSGGDHTHNVGSGQTCVECHTHDTGFSAAGGGGCLGCHRNPGDIGTTGPNTRRPVGPDFGLQSHHVGNGGAMGGLLTDFDCVVCHAEGTVSAGETQTTTEHMDAEIDLKDADDIAVIYSYDKNAVALSAGAATNWNSGNAVWRTQTSTELDPFCLSCHDSTGALQSFNSTDGGNAGNPFGDLAITNNYDQQDRGVVVDIKSKVSGNPPSQGQFSRHAIRGQSTSRYGNYTGITGGTSMYDAGLFVDLGITPPAPETGPLWNDTSVMGCADCHTTDGANGSAGNAHGSGSEYLLKDDTGGATEGTLAGLSYGCYQCHDSGRYQDGGGHTGSDQDWQDKTGLTGSSRRDDGKGSSFFAMACMNCHGGLGFGNIHGTSQVIPIGEDGAGVGATLTRDAYRFMNGAGLRFYDPNGWTGTSITCYTLSNNTTPDAWGACTQHNKGQGWNKPLQRPLNY
jgi:hypothetical protein